MVDLDARPPATAFSERTGLLGVRYMEAYNLSMFRLSKGKVGGTIWGSPVILLTVSGRRTGTRRTKPLLALADGDAWILVGSRGGTSRNPDWYENLLAFEAQAHGTAPADAVALESPVVAWAGDHEAEVRTTVLDGEERSEWWARLVAVYPKFESYQDRAPHRLIPVLRVTPSH